ncbi:MAG: alpha/beta hydrolase [candidate division Zixibacteria bacterium]|nr:alpha/beta hydrolase [candidate division Zixibacteria bacterium]
MIATVSILVAGLLVVLFVALSIMVYFRQGRVIFVPSREIEIRPDQVGLVWEDVFIEVADGERVHAWYFPIEGGVVTSRTVLFCHGNAGNISHRLQTVQLLLELGSNALIFDYRGFGRSDGKPTENNMYADARAVYHWLLKEKQITPSDVFLFGRSLGGAVAIDLAVSNECAGVVVESSFTSIVDMGRRLYPYMPVPLLARYRFDSISKIGQIESKVLITHSPDDEMVPYEMGRQLYEAASDNCTFVVLTGGHNDQSYFYNTNYRNGLQEFFGTGGATAAENKNQID